MNKTQIEIFATDLYQMFNKTQFSYTLFDTAEWKPTFSEREKLNRELIVHLLLFREAFRKNREAIKQVLNELAEIVKKRSDSDYLLMMLTYMAQSQNLDFDEVTHLMEESNMDEEVVMSNVAMFDVEKIWKRSGYREGIEKGMEKGIEKGIEKGVYAVARQMIREGLDIAIISKVTKLSIAEIQKIKASLN